MYFRSNRDTSDFLMRYQSPELAGGYLQKVSRTQDRHDFNKL